MHQAVGHCVAEKVPWGKSGQLHTEHVAEAAPVFRPRGSGTVQQPGRKIRCDQWRWAVRTGYMSVRQRRTEGRRDPVDCRILPSGLVSSKDYLLAVLPGIEYRKLAEIAHLTPEPLGNGPNLIAPGLAVRLRRKTLPTRRSNWPTGHHHRQLRFAVAVTIGAVDGEPAVGFDHRG